MRVINGDYDEKRGPHSGPYGMRDPFDRKLSNHSHHFPRLLRFIAHIESFQ